MKNRTKYTAKKVDAAVQAALAAYLLRGGSIPAQVVGSRQLILHLPAASKREGVDYIIGMHKRGFEVEVRKSFFNRTVDGILKDVYLPAIREQLNSSTILLKAMMGES
jgi:hypothetical protein